MTVSRFAAIGVGWVSLLAIVATAAAAARPEPIAQNPVAAAAVPRISSASPSADQRQRDRLNARLADMVRAGASPGLPAVGNHTRVPPVQRPSVAESAPPLSSVSSVSAASAAESPTISPPPSRPGADRPAREYRAPRLDLTTAFQVPMGPIECLTQAIYYEARNESEEGQSAVAEVIMNRSRSGRYPQDVCQVVYQRNSRTCQFTFTCDGSIGRGPVTVAAWVRAERIARQVYEGRSASLLPTTSVNYHASYVSPSWSRRLERVRQIGAHIFYGAPLFGGIAPGSEERAAAPATGRSSQGLVFSRNEALDRAFAVVMASGSARPANSQP